MTVLVPTIDRQAQLGRCVQSILNSTVREFELIVLDQSEGAPLETDDDRVRHVHLSKPGKAQALNAGLKLARSDVIALTDDDNIVTEDWLERGLKALLDDPSAAIVFGSVLPCAHDPLVNFVPSFTPVSRWVLTHRHAVRFPRVGMGANMFVRRAAVRAAGGWDPQIGPGGLFRCGDDWELAYRIVSPASRILIQPDITVTHFGIRSWVDGSASRLLFNNFYGFGAGCAKLIKGGDPVAAYLLARVLTGCVLTTLASLAVSAHPRNGRRILALASGFRAGWAQGQAGRRPKHGRAP